TPGFVRQYFQAAVFEYHPEAPSAPVMLRLLGDDLRDKNYADGSWRRVAAFQPASPVAVGQDLMASTTAFSVGVPSSVAQGHSLQVMATAAPGANVGATFDGKPLKLFPQGSTWLGYVGFDPQADVAS